MKRDFAERPVRDQLKAIERAKSAGSTNQEIAQRLKISGTRVSQLLALSRLSAEHREAIFDGIDDRTLSLDRVVRAIQQAATPKARIAAQRSLVGRVSKKATPKAVHDSCIALARAVLQQLAPPGEPTILSSSESAALRGEVEKFLAEAGAPAP